MLKSRRFQALGHKTWLLFFSTSINIYMFITPAANSYSFRGNYFTEEKKKKSRTVLAEPLAD